MSRKRFETMNCGVARALEQVGDWWSLLIVRDAFFGVSRFAQLEASLGISKNILSDRLQKLVEHGTGRRVAGLLAVDENGEPIDPSKLEWVHGPGLSAEGRDREPSSGTPD